MIVACTIYHMLKKILIVLSTTMFLILGTTTISRYISKSRINGLTKIESYVPEPQFVNDGVIDNEDNLGCGAVLSSAYNPSCGYCPGIIYQDTECYVDFTKLTEEQMKYAHLLK